MTEHSPITVPPILGVYAVEELVVTSAYSRVFRGRDRLLGRMVAIKVFTRSADPDGHHIYDDEEWRRRFIEEARLLGGIDHPHVVRVDALGYLADGTPYMVMPWHVANLRREIGRDAKGPERLEALPAGERPRQVTQARARDIVRQVCLGLAALHERGMIHRDVKPTNLLLTARENGQVRLCDLGFARRPGGGGRSRAGVWIGTPNYAAPEQLEDASRATDRADIYSAGVLAYRLLTGCLPIGAFPPVEHAGFNDLIRAAMSPRPSDRPTAVEMAAALHRLTIE